MKLGVIDSPNKENCHGKHVVESAEDTDWQGTTDLREIDQDCTGTETSSVIYNLIRAMADEGFNGPLNISWGAGGSRNPIRFARSVPALMAV